MPGAFTRNPFAEIMDETELKQLFRTVQCGANAPWPFVFEYGEPIRIETQRQQVTEIEPDSPC